MPKPLWNALALVAVVVAGTFSACGQSSVIDKVRVHNASEFDFAVDVTNDERTGWTNLGTARRLSTDVTEDVVDQGDVWIFRFQTQGVSAGELRVSRETLRRDRWTIDVPSDAIERVRQSGAPPSG
ncbi:MAG: hypothetical protein QOF21_3082 [Actinomycetota bacterium]|jgi:hypothetical protein